MADIVVVLGAGYTGLRVAWRVWECGLRVVATARDTNPLDMLKRLGAVVHAFDVTDPAALDRLDDFLPYDSRVLLSIPAVVADGQPDPVLAMMETLRQRAVRIVYISTTGVYGTTQIVDHTTIAAPQTPSQRARLAVEEAVQATGVSAMILRPAAIYGPGQGVHAAMRAGTYKLTGDGSNFMSRIHVEDLAMICEWALYSTEIGAYPVADDLPTPAYEVARYCADLLDLPMPRGVTAEEVHPTLRNNRRVDGSAIRQLLNVTLRYPTYREGIPAALAEEAYNMPS